MKRRVAMVGAGLSGAVIARELANAGIASLVLDERNHVAGNCHSERDSRTGIMVHCYGPHIFHTDRPRVWAYVNRFAEMIPFVLRVKATVRGNVYSLPVNLHTINQYFGTAMGPQAARRFMAAQAEGASDDREADSFEAHALRHLGRTIYEAFFRGYTRKQWGIDPADLPASILKRLPIRFDYNDNYFSHPWQAIPRDGYGAMVQRILDHPLIEVRLGCRFEDARNASEQFAHVFYSGGIDRYFGFDLGRLGYRTLDFERTYHAGDYQGTAIMNHPDEDVPFTRVTEHRHFAPWEGEDMEETLVFHEFSRACGVDDQPYYPIGLLAGNRLLEDYRQRALAEPGVTFVGRLGTYRYLDMDAVIDEALDVAAGFLARPEFMPLVSRH